MHILRIVLIIALVLLPLLGVQIALSIRKSIYPGLIIPALFFMVSILVTTFASNASSALLAFFISLTPCAVTAVIWLICRLCLKRRWIRSAK